MERGLISRIRQPFAIFVIYVLEYGIARIVRRPREGLFLWGGGTRLEVMKMFCESKKDKKAFQGYRHSWAKHAHRDEKKYINRRFRRWKKLNLNSFIPRK